MRFQKQIITWFAFLFFLLFSATFPSSYGMDCNDKFNEPRGCFLSCTNMEETFKENNRKLFSIKKFFLDLKKHDVKQMKQIFSEDVTFIITGKPGTVPLAGTYNGIEEVQRYMRGFYSSFHNVQIIFQYNLVGENHINTHVQMIAKTRSSGKTMNLEFVYNWMLNEDGKIKFLRLYYDTYSWYTAFQPGGPNYVEDFKGDMNFDIHPVNFDSLQLTKDAYAAYNTGNLPALMDKLDDNNFVFILKGDPNCVYPGIYHGKFGLLQFANNLFGVAYYTKMLTGNYFVVQGNHIDYHASEELVCYATGKIFRCDLVHSIIISDDGKFLEFKSYNDSFDVYQAFQP